MGSHGDPLVSDIEAFLTVMCSGFHSRHFMWNHFTVPPAEEDVLTVCDSDLILLSVSTLSGTSDVGPSRL